MATGQGDGVLQLGSEGEPHGGNGLRGYAFASAGKAELLGRRRFDADATG